MLEPCREDNLNLWFECAFENVATGLDMTSNSMPLVASTTFSNCGASVDGLDEGILVNSRVEVGDATQWALPSGSGAGFCIEGTSVTLPDSGSYNTSAVLFKPGQVATARDNRTGGMLLLLINNKLNVPLPMGVDQPLPGDATTPPSVWTLVNNRFNAAYAKGPIWNSSAVLLVGAQGGPAVVPLIPAQGAGVPQSQLLFGAGW